MNRRNFVRRTAFLAAGLTLLPRIRVVGESLAAQSPEPHAGMPVPPWWKPPGNLRIVDGGNARDDAPAVIPQDGTVIQDSHFMRWRADDIWPKPGRSGVVFTSEIDPAMQWEMQRCRISDCYGEAVKGRYGMTFSDVWFENLTNVGIMGHGPMTLHGRNLNFLNVCNAHPEIIWNNAGAIKVTGGDREIPAEPWVDVDGLRVYNCWNGPYFWADWGPVIRKIWNATLTGGCRWRGLMLELAAGDPRHTPTLKNIEIAHTNHEPAIGQPWGNVFNGVVLLMNSRNITAENLTIITPPRASAFAFQDDDSRHDHSFNAPAVLRDLDFRGGLIVLRGNDSTLERHYWHAPGKNGAGSNIKIRDFDIWVEAGSLKEAKARCESPFAANLRIRAMSEKEIDDGLVQRGQSHLLESASAHPRVRNPSG